LLIREHDRAPVDFSFHAVAKCPAEEVVYIQGEVSFAQKYVGEAD
jgi:hypothetical protein